jgi:hypothetical protein
MPDSVDRAGEEQKQAATTTETVKVRALIGRWEGQEIVLCGCSPIYDDLDEADWGDRLEIWENDAPAGTSEWKEVWLTVEIDHSLFDAPTLPSKAEAPDAS